MNLDMLTVIMLSIVMLIVVMLRFAVLIIAILSVVKLKIGMLNPFTCLSAGSCNIKQGTLNEGEGLVQLTSLYLLL
jgi:hypothetical protein